MAKIPFVFFYPHMNHTVQKFFKVQVLGIGISFYIHTFE